MRWKLVWNNMVNMMLNIEWESPSTQAGIGI